MPTREQVLANPCGTGNWIVDMSATEYRNLFKHTAAHEMGHMLGLGDGYYDARRGGDRMTRNLETSVRAKGFWTNMMYTADLIDRALPNDMEMILRAYSEDVRYRDFEQFYRTHIEFGVRNPISPEIRNRRSYPRDLR